MLLNNMPQYAQAPVKTYLETGKFKDHTPQPIPAEEVGPMTEEILTLSLGIISQDNTQADSNPKQGVIDSQDQFFGPTHVEFENIEQDATKTHGFGFIGTADNGASAYVRNTPEAVDIIIVGSSPEMEDGVIHLNQKDAAKSFMTLPPETMGLIAG